MKHAWIGIFGLLVLMGCSSEPEAVDVAKTVNNKNVPSEANTRNDKVEVDVHALNDNDNSIVTSEDWITAQESLQTPIETVGFDDGDAIIRAIGIDPVKVEESADFMGEPKKLYILTDGVLNSYLAHSPNSVSLNWTIYNDSYEENKQSKKNVDVAYKVARAMFGKEGAMLVERTMDGRGVIKDYPLNGQLLTSNCIDNGKSCFINFEVN